MKLARLQDRFHECYTIDPVTGCHNWSHNKISGGYGMLRVNGKQVMAHRYAYEQHYGVKLGSLLACHKCDNAGCVNPEHLFPGTSTDNNRDTVIKGRHRHGNGSQPGERNSHARLKELDIPIIRKRFAAGEVQRKIAEDYAVDTVTISHVCRRYTWRHVP